MADRVSADVAAHPDANRGTLDAQAMLVANTIGHAPRLWMRRLLPLVPIVFASAIG